MDGNPVRKNISRRGFAKLTGAAGVGGVAAAVAGCGAFDSDDRSGSAGPGERPFEAIRAAELPQPNILVILADDLGWADLSCYGAPEIKTPNLDRLAAGGVRYTNGYSASSTCSPTRIAFYTGRFPGRLPGGLPEPIGPPNKNHGIPPEHPTLASRLKEAGYRTVMIGKWHCGDLPWFSPTRSGWDSFFGNFSGGIDYFSKIAPSQKYDLYENEVTYHDLRYYTHILTERAVEFVAGTHAQPWLLNLNYTSPHWPWEGPGDEQVSRAVTARILEGTPAQGLAALMHEDGGSLRKYREMVEDLDTSVGQVLEALAASGAAENTVVLFFSDNGGERYSYHWPLTGAKSELFEGGIRVPTILSWPGKIGPNQVDHTPVTTLDWTATLLSLAGAPTDDSRTLDGADLRDYLFGDGLIPHRELFWRIQSGGALRDGDFKLLRTPDADKLFDLADDPREQANLAGRYPARLRDLVARWEAVNDALLPYPAAVVDLSDRGAGSPK
ncbi:sulfatase-like hydrolase/transferase [Nocardia rhamnosiphila]